MNKTLMTLVASLSYLTMTATNLEVINLSSEEASFELSKIQYIDFRGTEGFKIVGKDGSTLNETTYDQTRRIDSIQSVQPNSRQHSGVSEFEPRPTHRLWSRKRMQHTGF